MPLPGRVTAYRDGFPESHHRIDAAIVRDDGTVLAACGDPDRVTSMRSAAKPFQAEPLIASGGLDALGLDEGVLAVMCSSHRGADVHVAAVARGLAACGLDADVLRNALGSPQERLRHNCSGNHLAFLAHCVHRGWHTDGYRRPDHPCQAAALAVIAEHSGTVASAIPTMTDGCGVVAFGLPLRTIAAMFARLPATLPLQHATMTRHPDLVSGQGELDTEVMRAVPDVVCKGGAEGLWCAGLANERIGIALRVDDGAARGVSPAALTVLGELLGWAEPPPTLAALAEPVVPNSTGDPVVRLRAHVTLEHIRH